MTIFTLSLYVLAHFYPTHPVQRHQWVVVGFFYSTSDAIIYCESISSQFLSCLQFTFPMQATRTALILRSIHFPKAWFPEIGGGERGVILCILGNIFFQPSCVPWQIVLTKVTKPHFNHPFDHHYLINEFWLTQIIRGELCTLCVGKLIPPPFCMYFWRAEKHLCVQQMQPKDQLLSLHLANFHLPSFPHSWMPLSLWLLFGSSLRSLPISIPIWVNWKSRGKQPQGPPGV